MKMYSLRMQICLLLLSLFFIISCNRQNKTDLPKNTESDPITLDDKDKGKGKINFSTEGDIVVCSLMDKAGNLWFGTTGKGIFCYDGKTFKNFSQSYGLCNNTVFSIAEDKTGNIWFGTLNGISRYDGKSFTGIQIPVADSADLYPFSDESSDIAQKKESLSLKTVLSILQDKTGNFWFGTFGGGVFRYNGDSFTNFLNNEGAVYEDGLRHSVIHL